MSTVNPTPSICQSNCGGDGGAGNVQSWLNTVGKLGLTIGATAAGRPVTVTSKGTTIGSSASYSAQKVQGYLPLIIVGAIVLVALVWLSSR
jgi:hypothetical protein